MSGCDAVRQLEFFAGLPEALVARLAGHADERSLAPGDFVVRQHDDARSLFFLLAGEIQFLIHFEGVHDLLVGTGRQPGMLIGWSAFRPPYRYTASVRCETACRVVRIARDEVEAMIDESPAFGLPFLRRVAGSLANRLEQTRDLLVEPPWLHDRRVSAP